MKILVPLFTALLAAGAFIKIPVPPVPITLQTLFLFLLALLVPVKGATLSVVLYIFLGIIGLPILTAGGGIGAAMGPTAGYLWAMIPAAIVGAFLSSKRHDSTGYNLFVIFIMEIIIYIPGLLFLGISRGMTVTATLTAGLIPFIPGDIIKMIVAAIAAKAVYPECSKLLNK